MKRMFFAVVLLLSSALAQAAEPATPTQLPFALSCAFGQKAATATPAMSSVRADLAEKLGPGIPQPVFDTGCTASQQCPTSGGGSTTINCSGVGSCSVGAYWITCDGNTTYCGCVGCDLCNCDCLSGGGTALQCSRECRFNC